MEKQAEPEKPKPVVRKAAEDAGEGGSAAASGSASGTAIKAPLPGVITDIPVEVGQEVAAGDTVVVLEAMKMANALQAEKAGKTKPSSTSSNSSCSSYPSLLHESRGCVYFDTPSLIICRQFDISTIGCLKGQSFQ